MRSLLILAIILVCGGCSETIPEYQVVEGMQERGYTDVRRTGVFGCHTFEDCGSFPDHESHFSAKDKDGKRVTGVYYTHHFAAPYGAYIDGYTTDTEKP